MLREVRSHGGQKKSFEDMLKGSLNDFNIDVDKWETLVQERDIWQSIIVDGAVTSESNAVKEAEIKRQIHKSGANSNLAGSLPTNVSYHRLFHAGIGSFSHMCFNLKILFSLMSCLSSIR